MLHLRLVQLRHEPRHLGAFLGCLLALNLAARAGLQPLQLGLGLQGGVLGLFPSFSLLRRFRESFLGANLELAAKLLGLADVLGKNKIDDDELSKG